MMSQNIKVYIRCRPLKESETRNDQLTVKKEKKEVILKDKTFLFDNVFGEDSSQIEIYRAVLSPLIDQVLDGFNCTVFAYGQTGTGKTFTMEGEHTPNCCDWQSDPLAGLVPRSFCQLFECLDGRDCTIKVSFLELYNEELYDLLAPSDEITKLKMFDDINKKGSVIVCNLEETVITTKDQVYKLLQKGSAKRQTAATLLNACSSRSHTIFTITVYVTDETANGDEMVRIGKLNLVDLAGSESLSRSGAVDRRAREATCINQSLLSLGRVINCLVTKSTSHVPYRESKLTRLLQDSLGGRTRTSIVATISPSVDDFEDTASTLEYAQRAKRITNKPEANKRINKKAFLRDYAEKIAKLQKDLTNCINKEGIYLDGNDYNSMIDKVTKHEANHHIIINQEIFQTVISYKMADKSMDETQMADWIIAIGDKGVRIKTNIPALKSVYLTECRFEKICTWTYHLGLNEFVDQPLKVYDELYTSESTQSFLKQKVQSAYIEQIQKNLNPVADIFELLKDFHYAGPQYKIMLYFTIGRRIYKYCFTYSHPLDIRATDKGYDILSSDGIAHVETKLNFGIVSTHLNRKTFIYKSGNAVINCDGMEGSVHSQFEFGVLPPTVVVSSILPCITIDDDDVVVETLKKINIISDMVIVRLDDDRFRFKLLTHFRIAKTGLSECDSDGIKFIYPDMQLRENKVDNTIYFL